MAFRLASVTSCAVIGLEGALIQVEVDTSRGLPSWTLVGLLGGTLVWGAMGKVNTVGIEVVAFSLGMLWLNQLANLTENMAGELEPVVIGEI